MGTKGVRFSLARSSIILFCVVLLCSYSSTSAGKWVELGRQAWRLISTLGTLYSAGGALYVLINAEPSSYSKYGVDIIAEAEINWESPHYSCPSVDESGVYWNHTYQMNETLCWDEAGNFKWYYYQYFDVSYDPVDGWITGGEDHDLYGIESDDGWWSKRRWELALRRGALPNDEGDPDDDHDDWRRGGNYIYVGYSARYNIPDVPVKSVLDNDLLGSVIYSDLKAAGKKLDYKYNAKIHSELIPLTWIPGKNGYWKDGAKIGYWEEGKKVHHFAEWNDIKAYEDVFDTIDGDEIVPRNHKSVDCIWAKGGFKYWWVKLEYDKAVTTTRQGIVNGVPSGPITTNHNHVLRHVEYKTKSKTYTSER